MKLRILYLLVATLMSCGLLFTTSCTNRERQLDAALQAANKGFPQAIGEGTTMEGFFMDKDNIDIAVTLQEDKQTIEITPQRMEQMHRDFVMLFTQIAHQNKDFHEFFQLISDNKKTMSLSVTLMPSQKKHQAHITPEDIQQILSAAGKTAEEMAITQLDMNLEVENQALPTDLGPMKVTAVKREGKQVIWEATIDEQVIDFELMSADPAAAKQRALNAQAAEENMNLNRLIADAGCSILFRYIGSKSGRSLDIEITQRELRELQKNSVSTRIQ